MISGFTGNFRCPSYGKASANCVVVFPLTVCTSGGVYGVQVNAVLLSFHFSRLLCLQSAPLDVFCIH